MKRIRTIAIILLLPLFFQGCIESVNDNDWIGSIRNSVWTYGTNNPDGFVISIINWLEPQQGICVCYEDYCNCTDYDVLYDIVTQAFVADGYIRGRKDPSSGLMTYDSVKLYSENDMTGALSFARENNQKTVYIISTGTTTSVEIP